ncbi:ABC transporter permease [Candidatus Peregrinibacteria bacterium]|nr:ABC transporter permease [Candidatus Peregrinibacteria bacterium]
MLSKDLYKTAFMGITANTARSALTMLGIIIGVASVVLMVSIGNSFQNYVLTQIASIGTNTMDVLPSGLQKFGGNTQSLTLEDYNAIKQLSTVTSASPVILVSQPVHYGKDAWNPMVMGTRQEIFKNYSLKLDRGRLLDQGDDEGARSVAVVSAQTAIDLFGNVDPLGRRITVGEFSFTVVGVLRSQGSALLQDLDKPIYIPFSRAKAITGQTYLTYITLKTVGDPALAKADVTSLLRQRHHISNPENDLDKDDFIARSAEQISSIVNSVTLGLTIFLSLIAGISLLVGGIGIMNIMLVSVTERTREIGLRKAVGAKRRDILLQFLLEAVSLTLTGGIVGIVIGGSVGWVLAQVAAKFLGPFPFVVSLGAILLAVAMAVGTGLIFGLYPAKQAADLNPMDALRFE